MADRSNHLEELLKSLNDRAAETNVKLDRLVEIAARTQNISTVGTAASISGASRRTGEQVSKNLTSADFVPSRNLFAEAKAKAKIQQLGGSKAASAFDAYRKEQAEFHRKIKANQQSDSDLSNLNSKDDEKEQPEQKQQKQKQSRMPFSSAGSRVALALSVGSTIARSVVPGSQGNGGNYEQYMSHLGEGNASTWAWSMYGSRALLGGMADATVNGISNAWQTLSGIARGVQ